MTQSLRIRTKANVNTVQLSPLLKVNTQRYAVKLKEAGNNADLTSWSFHYEFTLSTSF